ncbi:MAG: bifunctional precorrin-2 dehydrogenase/sirohydrochlorin ferrochelatase [Syntrophomonadaceae bacterium]|jgi:precorrin-2 dehydrogenase/sirohydrochlorin ferrochelatase|nr:bifunctional precorrin-2 dehydrogenase/sirohydrochlorin ferrochelatase [Syntrophomonadaceae bacterium]
MKNLYPVYIDLNDRNCLIVGGGKVAERKIEQLLDYDCSIQVISLGIEDKIKYWAHQGLIQLYQREFTASDLEDVFMVFVATDNNQLNAELSKICRERGILVNAVDDPPHCDFYVPSILKRNSLVLAISTGGKSPAFARRLRRELEELITPAYGEFADILGEQRELIKERIEDIEVRKQIFEELVYSDVLDLLKAGEKEKAREKVTQCMSYWLE